MNMKMTRLADLTPAFIKPVLRPLYRTFVSLPPHIVSSRPYRICRMMAYRVKKRNILHQYWRQPWDGKNLPRGYLKGEARSQFLEEIMGKYTTKNARILEIGCNVGRNLNHLFLAGFKNLAGIEINENALKLMKESYPEMVRHIKIYNAPVEEIIKGIKDSNFDIVFTMAVLLHIQTDSEWIFPEVVRITKDYLISIENEHDPHWTHFLRNYRRVFEPLGMRQIEEINCSQVEGLSSSYWARIFKKI